LFNPIVFLASENETALPLSRGAGGIERRTYCQFNKLKVTPRTVIDWWHDTLSPRFTSPPKWIYTKTKKSSEKKDSSKKDHNFEDAEKFIREKFEVSKRDLDQIKKFHPDRYNAWLSSVSDQLGVKTK
jgi:hypothetical protein